MHSIEFQKNLIKPPITEKTNPSFQDKFEIRREIS